MRYWWVNHKQTFKNEFDGGYIWSPKTKNNGHFNHSYHNLTLTQIGDIIFSYADTRIKAIGIISDHCIEAAIPPEFGTKGHGWDDEGYLVKITWIALEIPFKPKHHITALNEFIPSKYSPIQRNGNGNQAFYLSEISAEFSEKLLTLILRENSTILKSLNIENAKIEEKEEKKEINQDKSEVNKIKRSNLSDTEKDQLIKARKGQGIFRNNLMNIEEGCRLTGITDPLFLIASHIKPWRSSSNEERLDGNNGLLLSPHIDRLFDKGWISFLDNGDPILSNGANAILKKWQVPIKNIGTLNTKQKTYLQYHRTYIFKHSELPHKTIELTNELVF